MVNDDEMQAMLIEYMGRGFLENIVALFKEEPELMRFIPAMASAEEMTVRLGVTALVEEMAAEYRDRLRIAVPGLVELLRDENPTRRGDAAHLLGVIADRSAIDALGRMLDDPNPAVREIAADAIREMPCPDVPKGAE